MNSMQTHRLTLFVITAILCACSSTKNLQLDTQFPVPLLQKTPISLGLHLDDTLLSFTYHEVINKNSKWNVTVGQVQEALFINLVAGMFTQYSLVNEAGSEGVDGTLKPEITDLQFSLPEQTRSDFYEVWIRYKFQLYRDDGTLVAEWPLPAYGKASKRDFGSAYAGVEAAAISACRDAMAFFAINFQKEPKVQQWLLQTTSTRGFKESGL